MCRATRHVIVVLVCTLIVGHIGPRLAAASEASGAETSGSVGEAQSSPYGPFRTVRGEPSVQGDRPARAYEPFEQAKRQHAARQGSAQAQYHPDRVLLKLAPAQDSATQGRSSMTTQPSIPTIAGLGSISPLFASSNPISRGRSLQRVAPEDASELSRWYRASVEPGYTVQDAVLAAGEHPAVELAEPDYLFKLAGDIPDSTTDPGMAQQWHLDTIRAREAWAHLDSLGLPPGGSRDVVVAVVDSGVDYTHPDLAANMWINRQEIAGNGVDDDWNGFVDDVYGVSVMGDERDHSGDPMDLNGHGTHVAGIIAAVADNNIGGVGVAYNCRIMAVKAAQYNGEFYGSDLAEGIYYAVENGADVINMSLSSSASSKVVQDALDVAFTQAVLVAAAGNDGLHNEEPPEKPAPEPSFPASYVYVLGVMAQRQQADSKGQNLASFSNWDNHPDSRIEYEVMAPGVDILSTLPEGGYDAWDGTSMAAPVVSGIAALVRTKFPNKATHSSRFIMGQIASTGPVLIGKQFDENDYMSISTFGFQKIEYPSADAYAALTDVPEPDLAYFEHWLFDTPDQGPDNDDDGILDAGETVDLAIVIRNRWGKGQDVEAILAPVAGYGGSADPYVTMITDTVNYGDIGSFNQDDNGLIYEDDVIVGVAYPFTFALAANTPNDHVVPFRLTITCRNGMDPSDSKLYTFTSEFEMVVQRGRELPKIISEDMTLTKEHYWIIDQPTFIPEGVTVTVTEGTQIQFWSPVPRSPYSYGNEPSLLVEGRLDIHGTADEPVELFPSERYVDRLVSVRENENGRITMAYVRVMNPVFGRYWYEQKHYVTSVDHAYFTQWGGEIHGFYADESDPGGAVSPYVYAFGITNSIFDELGAQYNYWADPLRPWEYCALSVMNADSCLFDSCHLGDSSDQALANNTFLGNYLRYYSGGGETILVSKAEQWGARVDLDTIYLTEAPVRSFQGCTYFALAFGCCYNLLNAQEFAEILGGSVASIHSDAERQFAGTYDSVTLGMRFSVQEDQPVWIDGTAVDYTPAGFGEPDSPDACLISFGGSWAWYDPGNSWPFLIKIPGTITTEEIQRQLDQFKASGAIGRFENNAFLNEWWNPDINYWMRLFGGGDLPCYLSGNYWGTTSRTLIAAAIHDWWDQFDLTEVIYEPILEEAPESAYPFVVDVQVSTDTEDDAQQVGAEEILFTVTFNRDMDTSVQPEVTFGPDVPFSDYLVNPVDDGWTDARTWIGRFEIAPSTGDGWQYIRVADAVAAGDPWLKTGNDERRFRFEIITGGLASIDLQAEPGPGCIDLSWHQDDFELFAGFNLYRSTVPEPNGVFTRLNTVIVPGEQTTYRDTSVQSNTTYYYKYAVVLTDMSESDYSNTVSAMPLEVNPPVIQHQPITSAESGLSVTLRAVVTDETGVTSVTLYYRQIGQTDYQSRSMVLTTNNRYSVTLEGTLIQSPGLQYYIEASDGVSTATSGSADTPYVVAVGGGVLLAIVHEPLTSAVAGQTLSISAQVTSGRQINDVTCFYRRIGQTEYQSLAMTPVGDDLFYTTLDSSLVQTPGLEYYIQASDSQSTVTSGSAASPHVITVTVVETGAPQIIHEPPTNAEAGQPLAICALVTDDQQVTAVTLHYRTMGRTTYQSLPMVFLFLDFYCATLGATAVEAPGLEYYIEASDGTYTTYYGQPRQPVQILLDQTTGETGVKLDNIADQTNGFDRVDGANLAVCQDFVATFSAGVGSTIAVTFLADRTTESHQIFLAAYNAANGWVDYQTLISTKVASNTGLGVNDDPLTATVTLTSQINSGTRYAACIVPSQYMEMKLTASASSIDGQSSKFVSQVSPGPEVARDTDFRLRIDVKTYIEPTGIRR